MRHVCLISLVLSVVLLAACGGDEPASPGSAENPLPALPNPSPTRVPPTSEAAIKRGASKASERASSSNATSIVREQKRVQARNTRLREQRAAKDRSGGHAATAGPRKQKAQAPSADQPCSLVSKTQARAIIGAAILEPLQAPQGPTCIYQTKTGKPYITLAVQAASYTRLQRQVRRRHSVAVANRHGICGSFGRSMLYLPIGGGRVLSIAGPCDIASRFAAQALPHL